ncbi:MAG: TolC family protein [Elusimicrobiota bacterium]|nr:TolC family protein [Elusimicrobiota bacterium]
MIKTSKFLLAACALCLLWGSANSQEGAASPPGGGLDLEECLLLAVKNNPEIQLSRQEVAAAKGDRLSAISGFLPKLQFKGAAQRQSEGSFASDLLATQVGSSVKRSPEIYHLGLEFEQPIYVGGYTTSELGFAKAQLSRASSRLEDKVLNINITVSGAYYEILGLEKRITALREAADFMSAHRKVVAAQVKARVALKPSLLSAELLYLTSRRDLMKAQNALQLAKRRFSSLLGRDAGSEFSLKGDLKQELLEVDISRAAGHGIDSHPSVLAAKSSVDMGGYAVGMVKADLYRPKIKLIGNYNITEDKWVPQKDDWSFGLGLEIPLFTSKPFGRVKKYEAELAQAKTILDFSKEQIALEIQSAYIDFTQGKEALEITGKGVEQGEENVRICNLGYAGGTVTNEQLLEARRDLTRATLEHISTLCEYNQAQAKLKYHLGPLKKNE